MTVRWLVRETATARQRGSTRGRSERNRGSVDKVKPELSYLCLSIRCAYCHNVHHFQIQNHFGTSLYSSVAHLSISETNIIICGLFFFPYLFSLFILKRVHRWSSGSCHGKTECTKWWFIPAFPGPLQNVARLCFCFFFSSAFFFWYHFFQLGTSVCMWQVCHCGLLRLFVYHSWL